MSKSWKELLEESVREMAKRRIVILPTEMDVDNCKEVCFLLGGLQTKSFAPIQLLIDSVGGNRNASFAVHNLIKHVLICPVHALVTGRCYSGATFALLSCDVRRSLPNARFKIHSGKMANISSRMEEQAVQKNIDGLRAELIAGTNEIIEFYVGALNKPREEIQELLARGDAEFNDTMTAKEALEIGLITEIVKDKAGIFSELNAL